MDDVTPPPSAVFDLAERAVEYVRRTVGVPLDYTPETLPALDHYVRQVPRDQPATVELVATAAGAYFGEVCRRALGGEWRFDEATPPREWRVELPGDVGFSPIGFAAEAITHAELEEYDGSFEVPAAERAAVEEALSARAVPEDEYYSFSGRLEVLTHVVEIVAARRATRSGARR